MSNKSFVRGTTVIDAVTEPFLIQAYVRSTGISVMDRQVEIVVYFDDVPDPRLSQPKKFISREPEVVAFMRRVHGGIHRRTIAIDVKMAELRKEAVA